MISMANFNPIMKLILQRVSRGSVIAFNDAQTEGKLAGEICKGLVLLVGFCHSDNIQIASRIAKKLLELRIFEDETGKMNRSVTDLGGELLVVSQFTLYGDTHKGRRPGFSDAMPPAEAKELYNRFVVILEESGLKVASGVFGARMKVEIINDGPVTFILEDEASPPQTTGR